MKKAHSFIHDAGTGIRALVFWGMVCMGAAGRPDLFVETPVHHAGRIEDLTVSHDFVLSNRGDEPVRIGAVHACCGMTANLTGMSIEPGSNILCRTLVRLDGRSGEVVKAVQIATSDPRRPICRLELRCNVVPILDAMPAAVMLGNLSFTTNMERQILVRWRKEGELWLTNATRSAKIEVVPERVGEREWRVKIRTLPPLPAGLMQEQVVLLTNRPERPRLTLPVSGEVDPALQVIPREIILWDEKKPGPAQTRYLSIRSGDGVPYKIETVNLPDPRMTSSIRSYQEGSYRIEIGGIQDPAALHGEQIRIKTTHPRSPEILLPIRTVE